MDQNICTIRVSSSIRNFRKKLLKRTGAKEYFFPFSVFNKTIFFGLYHPIDWLIFIFHLGKKKAFWTGGDILNLRKTWWRYIIRFVSAKHYCENKVEQEKLISMGLLSEIRPLLFDPEEVKVNFKPSKSPHIYLSYHPGREKEYGMEICSKMAPLFPHITFHYYGGEVSEENFNEEIKNYQSAIRLNKFDGFSETLAKSVLMGQYPISWIPYPHITHVHDGKSLRIALENLPKKKEPNYEAAAYWRKRLKESLDEILS